MTTYILGILVSFLSLVIYAPINILDSYLSNRFKSTLTTVVLFNSLIPLLMSPILFFFGVQIIPASLFLIALVIAVIEVLYQFPYLKAFQVHNTSSVVSLFSIGKIFIPVLAYIMVGERITLLQYLGFFIIIVTSMALTYSKNERLKLNSSFFYMTIVSLMLSLQGVLYKYLFEHIQWATGFFWVTVTAGILAILLFILMGKRSDLVSVLENKKSLFVISLPNALSWIAESLATLAISLIPVTVAKGINSAHPLAVLGVSYIAARYFPNIINKPYKDIFSANRILIYILMIMGVILVTVNI